MTDPMRVQQEIHAHTLVPLISNNNKGGVFWERWLSDPYRFPWSCTGCGRTVWVQYAHMLEERMVVENRYFDDTARAEAATQGSLEP